MTDHQRGLFLTSLGVLVIVPDATLIRLIDAPSLTTAMWRTGLMAVAMTTFLALRYRSGLATAVLRLGPWGVVSSVLSGTGTVLFVVAIDRTTVANVVLIIALTPMFAAIISWATAGSRVPTRTLVAMPFAFIGVALAVGGSIDGGLNAGDAYALWASVGLAANMTIVRARSDVDMVPTTAIGGLLGCLTLLAVGTGSELTSGDLAPLLLLGLVIMPAAMGLLTAGGRWLSSAETTLLLLGETALSPLLAAVAVDEPLERSALIGGAVVLATLLVHGWLGLSAGRTVKMLQ